MEAKEFSLAILGDKGVGKTSFCNRYINNTFNPNEEPTNGGEYFQRIFTESNVAVKIDIFDASGDPKSKNLVKYLFKDARSIILMFDLNEKATFDNLNTYLEDIKNNSVEDPIIYLVGNFSNEVRPNGHPVTKEAIKKFLDETSFRYFDISCKTSADGVNKVMKELTNEIINSEKYFNSTIDRDISEISIKDTNEKDFEKLSKTLKNFYKETKEKKNKFIRCKVCHKLLFIRYRNNGFTLICPSCKSEENKKITELFDEETNSANRVVCYECLKIKEEKIKLDFCNKCKHFVCPKCKNVIIKQLKAEGSEIHNLVPYYLMDITCNDHIRKVLGYCKTCNKNFCDQGYKQHGTHENIFFDDDLIERIKAEHKSELEKEISNFKQFQRDFTDCIKSITSIVNNFIELKKREIQFKEQLLNQLNYIPYNYQLIESIKNMKYMKQKKYDPGSSWDKKLTDIFEVIGQPIQVKNINVTKNETGFIVPKIIQIKDLKKDDEIKINENINVLALEKSIEVTDFCSMNDDKYLGISFDNGKLELYEKIVENKNPIQTFQIFSQEEGIKSMCKSNRNVNNFFFCGKDKIKNIEFYDGYKNMRILMNIVDNKKLFKFVLEQDNCIISCDYENRLIIYENNENKSNKKDDFTESIIRREKKNITSLIEIMNNVIYITFDKDDYYSNSSSSDENSYFFEGDTEELNIDNTALKNKIKEKEERGTKILELDKDNHKIKREHALSEKQKIIGSINDKLILIRDDEYNSLNLFDATKFKNIQRIYFEEVEKPIFCSILNRRNTLIDLIIVSENMTIFQNIYEEEYRNIKQISGLKVNKPKRKEEEENIDICKEGKIIHLPFKGLVKYLGKNKFAIINY